jgi:hypothetical protein
MMMKLVLLMVGKAKLVSPDPSTLTFDGNINVTFLDKTSSLHYLMRLLYIFCSIYNSPHSFQLPKYREFGNNWHSII